MQKTKETLLQLLVILSGLVMAVVVILLSEGRILKAGAAEKVLRSREPEDAFGVTPGFSEAEDGLHIHVKEARLDNPSGLW